MSRRILFAALVITALLVSLTGTVAAAPPADNPGNGPPDFAKVVFIHYADDAAPAKGGIPGPPRREGEYKYDGIHWADADVLYVSGTEISGIPYYVNLDGRSADFLGGIQAALQTWEDEPNSYMDFGYYGETEAGMSAVGAGGNMDGLNVIGWKDLTDDYGAGVIAVAAYWYNIATRELVEVDIAMNSAPSYAWWQNAPGETWTAGNDSEAFDVDVQNIITHESGHALVLGDLYADSNSEKTMYGYSGEFELTSRSLEPGDEAGIQAIYPITDGSPSGGTMNVAAIDMWYTTGGPNFFIYTKVTVVDADDAPVPGVVVYLETTLPDGSTPSGSGETNGDGTVTFKLKSRQSDTYTSNVMSVTKDGWEYDQDKSLELEDDTDADGNPDEQLAVS